MAKVFIHVGPHKTGSTYVQKQLRQHADALAGLGVSYPDLKSPLFGHGPLARRLRGWGPPPSAEELSALVDRDVLILSSENFVLLTRKQLATLRDGLAGHELAVVFVLRSLTKVLPSHWQETIKHGNTQTFLEYLARINGWIDGDYDHVVPSRQLAKFAEVFGRDSLRVISYENADDLCQTFGQVVLGERSPAFAGDQGRVNKSFPPERVELVRQLNLRFQRTHGRTAGQHLRVSYVRSSGSFEASPEYAQFVAEFETGATSVTLSDADPFVRQEMSQVIAQFGPHVVNPAPSVEGDAIVSVLSSLTRCALSSTAHSSEVSRHLDELFRVHEPRALELLGLNR